MKKLMLNICVLVIFCSCQSDKIKTHTGEEISYKDSVFLKIEGDLFYPDVMWQNVDTWVRAQARMVKHRRILNNQFVWNVENGAQVKISENIYDYITRWWGRQNEKLATGDYAFWPTGENMYTIILVRERDRGEFVDNGFE